MAVDEINAKGGVLGKKLELQIVDDACDAQVAYESAKAFLSDSDVAGVIGGMCDAAAEREVPVIDSTGIPFLVTSATADDLVNEDSQSTFMMNGTVYQQALSSVFWMNYRQAQRLAVRPGRLRRVQGAGAARRSASSRARPSSCRCRPSSPAGQDMKTIARPPRSPPSRTSSSGRARPPRAASCSRRCARPGYKGTFSATAASESPEFLSRGRHGRRGRVRDGHLDGAEHADGARSGARASSARYQREPGFEAQQAYDSVRTLAHAIQKAKTHRRREGRQDDDGARSGLRQLARRRALRRTITRCSTTTASSSR